MALLGRHPELALHTRRNWQIPNEVRPERPAVALRAAVELHKKSFPDARLRSITALYNCMGMVVACRRTHIDPVYLETILSHDGYRKLPGSGASQTGDIVVYLDRDREPCHVAIVVEKTPDIARGEFRLQVVSKWGADGEYIHGMHDVPALLGTPSEFWTDRKEL